MTVNEAIDLLLHRMVGFPQIGSWTSGNEEVIQKHLNKALTVYNETGSTKELAGVASTLYAMGGLSDSNYDQIVEALGEK